MQATLEISGYMRVSTVESGILFINIPVFLKFNSFNFCGALKLLNEPTPCHVYKQIVVM